MEMDKDIPGQTIFSLSHQKQLVEEVTLNNLGGKDQYVINKCKDTSFIHWVITKCVFQTNLSIRTINIGHIMLLC